MNYETPWVKLSVRFDVDQTSSQLDYTFTSSDMDPMPAAGKFMGQLYFEQGQHLYFDVTAIGNAAGRFTSFQIVDACLITRPQMTQFGGGQSTCYSPPSPFLQSAGACYSLPLDFSSRVLRDPAHPELRRIQQEWKRSLNIGHTGGRWEFSFVLTVLILRGESGPSELRVFSFDPEGSVGGGTGWDTPP